MLMKNVIIALCALLAAHVPAEAQVVKTIDISDNKPLSQHVASTEEAFSIDSIRVVGGELDSDDYYFLARCCQNGRLTGIDLSDTYSRGDLIPDGAFKSLAINVPSPSGELRPDMLVKLHYIRLPRGLRHIGDEAFLHSELRMIEIPRSVESIGQNAFNFCKDLREVVVHNTNGADINAAYAFDKWSTAARLAVPVGSSGSYASVAPWNKFADIVEREGLYTLRLKLDGSGLESQLGDRLLTTDSLSLSGHLAAADFAALRRGIFHGVLTGIDLGSCTVENNAIPNDAFFIYDSDERKCITEIKLRYVTLPEGITEIGSGAFGDNLSLRFVNIPSTVTEIQKDAFYGCRYLLSATVPEGVTTLHPSVFEGCNRLSMISLPSTLSFMGVKSLRLRDRYVPEGWNVEFRVNRLTPPEVDTDGYHSSFGFIHSDVFAEALHNSILYVPVGAKPAYEADEWWSCFATIIETSELDGGTTGISDAAPDTAAATKFSGIYTLGGQYVGTDLNALGSGVYVVNGRKVVK